MYSKNTAGSGRFMKHIRINGKRTVSKGKYLWKAVLFCVGALLLYDSFHERNVEEGEETGTGRYVVVRESLAGQEEVPLEEYLIGALAAACRKTFPPRRAGHRRWCCAPMRYVWQTRRERSGLIISPLDRKV